MVFRATNLFISIKKLTRVYYIRMFCKLIFIVKDPVPDTPTMVGAKNCYFGQSPKRSFFLPIFVLMNLMVLPAQTTAQESIWAASSEFVSSSIPS